MRDDKEIFNAYLNDTTIQIAIFFYTTYGFPHDLFVEELKKHLITKGDQLRFCLNFYKQHKKYCKKNGNVGHWDDIKKKYAYPFGGH